MASQYLLRRCLKKTHVSDLSDICIPFPEIENIGRGTSFQEKNPELGGIMCEFEEPLRVAAAQK